MASFQMPLGGLGGAVDKPHAYRVVYRYMLSDHQLKIVKNIIAIAFQIKARKRRVIFHCAAKTVIHVDQKAVSGVIHKRLVQIAVSN